MKKIFRSILCVFGFHEWTCAAKQGIKPPENTTPDMLGFWEYAKMYCLHCNIVYHESQKRIEQAAEYEFAKTVAGLTSGRRASTDNGG